MSNENQSAPDVREIMRGIEETVRRKREQGAYPPEVAAEIDESADTTAGQLPQRVARAVAQMRQALAFSSVVSTESSKPYVGPAVSGVKRGVQKMTRWYVAGVLDQVRIFGETTLRATKLLADHTAQLERRVRALEDEIASLERRTTN